VKQWTVNSNGSAEDGVPGRKKLAALKGHDFRRASMDFRPTQRDENTYAGCPWSGFSDQGMHEPIFASSSPIFDHAAKAMESTWASAPEACLPPISSEIPSFSRPLYAGLPGAAAARDWFKASNRPRSSSSVTAAGQPYAAKTASSSLRWAFSSHLGRLL